jgi:hypothetical protein
MDENKTAITVNTIRVKKEKQDTMVTQETLNQSLKAFKAKKDITIEYIRLRPMDMKGLNQHCEINRATTRREIIREFTLKTSIGFNAKHAVANDKQMR